MSIRTREKVSRLERMANWISRGTGRDKQVEWQHRLISGLIWVMIEFMNHIIINHCNNYNSICAFSQTHRSINIYLLFRNSHTYNNTCVLVSAIYLWMFSFTFISLNSVTSHLFSTLWMRLSDILCWFAHSTIIEKKEKYIIRLTP